jgi:hypothetical protein
MHKFFLSLLLLATACATEAPVAPQEIPSPTPAGQAYMSLLVRFLTGTFESVADDDGTAPARREKLRQTPFWKDAKGEFWLYAEFADTNDEARPYRQRIYRFTESKGLITAAIFEVPGKPADFAGEWRKPAPFASFKPSDLRERRGCAVVFIQQMEMIFNGGRAGEDCRGEFPGAHHEHAEFYVTSSSIRTLENGRDAAGKRAAGPPRSSEFRKILQIPG